MVGQSMHSRLCQLLLLAFFGCNILPTSNGMAIQSLCGGSDDIDNATSISRKHSSITLKVMTFNTWVFGRFVDDGPQKIAKNILAVNPDIVALQEVVRSDSIPPLLTLLGDSWMGMMRSTSRSDENVDNVLLSRHLILTETCRQTSAGIGCNVLLRSSDGCATNIARVWSLHLDWKDYGPYALCTATSELPGPWAYKYPTKRLEELTEVLSLNPNEDMPTIILGDFNEPSHLDWTENARSLHCGQSYRWDMSAHLQDRGFSDAFRTVFPDPSKDPGNTWSTTTKYFLGWRGDYSIPEPQDRIDFAYLKGAGLRAVNASVFRGNGLIQAQPFDVGQNDWPSDHSSVVVDVELAML